MGTTYVLLGHDWNDAFKYQRAAWEKRAREKGDVVLLTPDEYKKISDIKDKIKPGANIVVECHGGAKGTFTWGRYESIPYSDLFKALPEGIDAVTVDGCHGGSAIKMLDDMPSGAVLQSRIGAQYATWSGAGIQLASEITAHQKITPLSIMLEALDNTNPYQHKVDEELYLAEEERTGKVTPEAKKKRLEEIAQIDPNLVLPHTIGIGGNPPIALNLNDKMAELSAKGKSGKLDATHFQKSVLQVKGYFDRNGGKDWTLDNSIDAVANKLRGGADVGKLTLEEKRIGYALTIANLYESGEVRQLIQKTKEEAAAKAKAGAEAKSKAELEAKAKAEAEAKAKAEAAEKAKAEAAEKAKAEAAEKAKAEAAEKAKAEAAEKAKAEAAEKAKAEAAEKIRIAEEKAKIVATVVVVRKAMADATEKIRIVAEKAKADAAEKARVSAEVEKAKAEAAEKAKAEAAEKAKAEAAEKAKAEAAEKAKAEAAEKAKAEAAEKAKAEAAEKAKAEAAEKAKAAAAEKAKAEAAEKAKAAAAEKAKAEAAEKAKAEAAEKAKAEAAEKAKAEAAEKAKAEAAEKAKAAAAEKAKAEAAEKAKAEAAKGSPEPTKSATSPDPVRASDSQYSAPKEKNFMGMLTANKGMGILGIVGAIVGYFISGPIGILLGGMLGAGSGALVDGKDGVLGISSNDSPPAPIMTPKLQNAVTAYANARFADPDTGIADQQKVSQFVSRYGSMVAKNIPPQEQDKRAEEIKADILEAATQKNAQAMQKAMTKAKDDLKITDPELIKQADNAVVSSAGIPISADAVKRAAQSLRVTG